MQVALCGIIAILFPHRRYGRTQCSHTKCGVFNDVTLPAVFDGKFSLWEPACRLVHDGPHLTRSHCLHEEEDAVRVLFMSMVSNQGYRHELFFWCSFPTDDEGETVHRVRSTENDQVVPSRSTWLT